MEGERGGGEVKHPSVGIRDRTSLANVPPTLFVSVGSHTPAEKEERNIIKREERKNANAVECCFITPQNCVYPCNKWIHVGAGLGDGMGFGVGVGVHGGVCVCVYVAVGDGVGGLR